MDTIYTRLELFRLLYPSQVFYTLLVFSCTLPTPWIIPSSFMPPASSYITTRPTSTGTFICSFSRIKHAHMRRQEPLSRFKSTTFMPLALLTEILTSCCKKREQMIYQRFSFKMTWSAYSTSRNGKTNKQQQQQKNDEHMRVEFKYSCLIYSELQKRFKIAPQLSRLCPVMSTSSRPRLVLRQPEDIGGLSSLTINASFSPHLLR